LGGILGFYIRKGFNFGPLRLNLSRSGLGASIGVKGFRFGSGPRGAYVHAGRGGLYYRQSLSGRGSLGGDSQRPALPPPLADPLQPVDSGDVGQMVNASAVELLAELNRVEGRTQLAPFAGLLLAAIGALEFYQRVPVWAGALTLIVGVALVIYARHRDVTRGTAVLQYSLDGDAEARFNALKSAFAQFAACQGLWHIEASGQTDDWKRNAGATGLLRRTAIRPGLGLPRRVATNVEVPVLVGGRQRLYFFPDQILVYDGSRVGAVAYAEVRATVLLDAFAETQQVPTDAKVVGSTWRYVNKKGGPDRRFNDNREIPLVQYGNLQLESDSGLREHFECSRPETAQALAQALATAPLAPEVRRPTS